MKTLAPKSNTSRILLSALILLAMVWVTASQVIPTQAFAAGPAPIMQIPIYTPTPGADGRIIYIVKTNDTLLTISLLTGVSVEELKELNNLTSDVIFEGQQLLLGFAGPAEVTATAGPTPTATQVLPTPTPKPGKGELCIILFNDINGDSIRQEEEPSIPDGAISFNNRLGTASETAATTAGLDPQCFVDLPEGEYTITVAVPEGYNSTTSTTYELILQAGASIYLNFGAQANSQTLAEAPTIPAPEGSRSPILGIVGGLFLLAGVGAAIFARRLLKGK